jgi:hypothetical protein
VTGARQLVFLGLAGSALLGSGFALPQTSESSSKVPAATSLRLETAIPPWVAPMARLELRGWASARTAVSLLAGGQLVATTASGRFGRFSLSVRFRTPGRYRLVLSAAHARVFVGSLEVRAVVLAAVGDVTYGEGVGERVLRFGAGSPWQSVGPLLRHADIATANLEGSVSERGAAVGGKQYTFRGPPQALAGTAGAGGIDVLTVANNHSMDFGPDAFADTLQIAHADGIETVGGGATLALARRPAILERGGLRLAFVGYSDINPAGFKAVAGSPGTAPADPAMIAADVAAARKRADVVVVWFHWGVERARTPNARQRELAAVALNAGAAVVLGAHPHVLQPIAAVSLHRLIAWSLGNFVFPAGSPEAARSGILFVQLDAHGVRGHRLQPVVAGAQPQLGA